MPDAASSDDQWTEYLFLDENLAGEIYEWWLHAPTNTWFIARRNTVTDNILETMTVDAYFARQPNDGAGAQHERRRGCGPSRGRRLRTADRSQAAAVVQLRWPLHSGFEGDVIASALYAEGRTLLSRSFKYHRPRGVLTMAGQDANTMVQVGGAAQRAGRSACARRRHGG